MLLFFKKFFKENPVLMRFLIVIVLPIFFALMLGYSYLIKSVATKTGVINIEDLADDVQIVRNKEGIPYISAKTDVDAFFALGFVHAQDRMWQIDFQRRLGQGRLSEILGADALGIDKTMRTLGIKLSADKAFDGLNELTKTSLVSYAKGINAWIDKKQVHSPEYVALRIVPEHWSPEDSLLLGKLIALELGYTFDNELTRSLLINEFGPQLTAELLSRDENYFKTAYTDAQTTLQSAMLSSKHIWENYIGGGEALGSNGWVVAGSLTKTGKPLLAADPHLSNQIPSSLYMAALKGDQIDVVGATFPGIPFVIYGHNQYIAWGATNLMADVQDIYMERINPLNSSQYEIDGKWVDIEEHEEWIKVKADLPGIFGKKIPDLKWKVRKTVHGPLLSDVLEDTDQALSLRWTALQYNDSSFDSLYRINYAENLNEFEESLAKLVSPALNYVYADKHGDIALLSAGAIPIRKISNGSVPVAGWDSSYGWDGLIPASELPKVVNPKTGFIVNSNNKVHNDHYPYIISNDWSPDYRVSRIRNKISKMIESNKLLIPKHMAEIQSDVISEQAKQLLPFIKRLVPTTPSQRESINVLLNWDGDLNEENKAAALYQVWFRHFNKIILSDELKGELLTISRSNQLQVFARQLHPELVADLTANNTLKNTRNWCDQIHTERQETCEDLGLIALDYAQKELKKHSGKNTEWGEIFKNLHQHTLFKNIQLLEYIFNREVNGGGDEFTVNVAGWNYSKKEGYTQMLGPSYRQVIDLASWENSGFIINTGQSGNIFSEHYDDLIDPHKKNKLIPMALDLNPKENTTLVLKKTSKSKI